MLFSLFSIFLSVFFIFLSLIIVFSSSSCNYFMTNLGSLCKLDSEKKLEQSNWCFETDSIVDLLFCGVAFQKQRPASSQGFRFHKIKCHQITFPAFSSNKMTEKQFLLKQALCSFCFQRAIKKKNLLRHKPITAVYATVF